MIAEAVSKTLALPVSSILDRSQNSSLSRARDVLAHIAVDHYRFTLKEVSRYLGRDPSSVTRIRQKISANAHKGSDVGRLVENVVKSLEHRRTERHSVGWRGIIMFP
jgi:chromosomal replication initiation ATPase DnaA